MTKYIEMTDDGLGAPGFVKNFLYKKGSILKVVERKKEGGRDLPMPFVDGEVPEDIAEGFCGNMKCAKETTKKPNSKTIKSEIAEKITENKSMV